jgi:hypothetical protein
MVVFPARPLRLKAWEDFAEAHAEGMSHTGRIVPFLRQKVREAAPASHLANGEAAIEIPS